MSAAYNKIIPVGYNPKNPVGTGPFKYKSFTPGVQSTFVRNENYWQSGLPYADELVIDDYPDSTPQVNALLSGAANMIGLIPYSAIKAVKSAGNRVVISPGTNDEPITMRVDRAPFNDRRVRQALRLSIDRPQMLKLLYGDTGLIGNDIFSNWDPSYDHSIPQRHQDLDQAKSLLKAAGHHGLTVNLTTAEIAQGTNEMCEIFKQQAQPAGINVQLQVVTPTVLYGPNYQKWTFAVDEWFYYWYLSRASLETLSTGTVNETHFHDPNYDALYYEAIKMLDFGKRTELIHEMQQIDYNDGGLIIPFFAPLIDVVAPSVRGALASKTGNSFDNFNFKVVSVS